MSVRTDVTRGRWAGGCAMALCLSLTLCLGSALSAAVCVESPTLHGSVDYVYACAGVNLNGRFRFGYAYASNLTTLTPVYDVLSDRVCGYYPRPPFLALESYRIYQP